jgi:hypothetical protein
MHERHGHNGKDRIYRIWVAMRQRCGKEYRSNFSEYGGRGITVCEEWERSFVAFKAWADANGYAPNLSIDRIDNDKGYSPENCRWATAQQQVENRRAACAIEVDGEVRSVAEWARVKNMHMTTLYRRYWRGVRGEALFDGCRPKSTPK